MLKTIFFFPLDKDFKEGKAVPVSLLPDGAADLSKLPAEVRDHLLSFGVIDPIHQDLVSPKQGENFLTALLASSGAYWRFRSTPQVLN